MITIPRKFLYPGTLIVIGSVAFIYMSNQSLESNRGSGVEIPLGGVSGTSKSSLSNHASSAGHAADLKKAERAQAAMQHKQLADKRAAKVIQASYKVYAALKEDEASRAQIISEIKGSNKWVYRFEIAPNPNFKRFLTSEIDKISGAMGLESNAVRTASINRAKEFMIPDGKKQRIEISVPLERTQKIVFFSSPYEMDSNNISMPPFNAADDVYIVSGSVPFTSKGWRYDNLLDSN